MKKRLLFLLITILCLGITVNAKEVTDDYKLSGDITDGIHVPEGKEVVLDLNDYNISGTINNIATIYNEGTLTIKGLGNVTSDYYNETDPSLIVNEGTIIIESGTYNGGAYPVLNKGKATIKGGNFTRTGGTNIAIKNDKTLTIEKGTFQGQVISTNNINIKDGTFNGVVTISKKGKVTGGNFKVLLMATDEGTELDVDGATVSTLSASTKAIINVYDATVSGQVQAISNGVVNIYDGEFNGTLTVRGSESKINASGGVYKYRVTNDYLDTGFVCRERADGKFIVLDPDNISLKMIKKSIESLESEEEEIINNALQDTEYQIGASYDVTIKEVTDKGEELGTVSETDEELEVTLEVPEELQNVPENTEREFVIIRVHNGEAEELVTTDNKDGTLTAKSNLFSTYTVAYKDTVTAAPDDDTDDDDDSGTINYREEETNTISNNPKTNDNILLFVILFSVSTITLVINTKKLLNNN